MADGKSVKIGFSIKLSEETAEKLKAENPDPKNNSPEIQIDDPVDENRVLDEKGESSEDEVETRDDSVPVVESKNEETSTATSEGDFSKHIRYEGNDAVYTDPATNIEYVWNNEKGEWCAKSQETSPADVAEPAAAAAGVEYGFENDTHTYTDADGTVYFWDKEKNAWFPKVDEDFLAHYQMAYGFVDNATPVEEKTAEDPVAPVVKKGPEEPKWFDMPEDQNNKVYVSNLPLDITEEEFVDLMQKCGLVMKDPSTQKMKIKIYTKANSNTPKGDALCTYIRVESVELALNILDGYCLRDHRIKVQRAKFQMKGTFNPALKPKKKRRKDKEKLKKMQERLFDWRPEKMRGERAKHERIVIIKNLFEPSLFDTEVHLILEYQQDMREECAKCGEVKKVVIYDRHPDGVAQVSMKEAEDAENVVQLINGRWFGKRQLTAEIWDGKTKYKMEETDADLNKRIDGWNNFLDGEDKQKVAE